MTDISSSLLMLMVNHPTIWLCQCKFNSRNSLFWTRSINSYLLQVVSTNSLFTYFFTKDLGTNQQNFLLFYHEDHPWRRKCFHLAHNLVLSLPPSRCHWPSRPSAIVWPNLRTTMIDYCVIILPFYVWHNLSTRPSVLRITASVSLIHYTFWMQKIRHIVI